jgi:hypothetical protein
MSGSLPGISVPWLDAEPNLYFGVHAANAGTGQSFLSQIDDFSVTIIPEPSGLAVWGIGIAVFIARGARCVVHHPK